MNDAPEKIWAQCSAHENWDDLSASIYPVSHWHQYIRTDLCLTQADLDAAVLAERERCALVASSRRGDKTATLDRPYDKGYIAACCACAAAIMKGPAT
jgi:hypothetical protein